MKLYNVYRLCKQNIEFFKKQNLNKKEVNNNQITYELKNWTEFRTQLKVIRKIPVLTDYVNDYFNTIPVFLQDEGIIELS